VGGAVTRYRVMSYVTGTMLILLCFVAVPLDLAGQPLLSTVVGMAHGMVVFPLYLVLGFDLYRRARWPLSRMVLLVAAGVIPFLTFTVERRIVRELRAATATDPAT
jgi:integral membrane protein